MTDNRHTNNKYNTSSFSTTFHRKQHPIRWHLRTEGTLRRSVHQAYRPQPVPGKLPGSRTWRLHSAGKMGRRPYSRFPLQGRSVNRPLWSPPEEINHRHRRHAITVVHPLPSTISKKCVVVCVRVSCASSQNKRKRTLQTTTCFGETSADTV